MIPGNSRILTCPFCGAEKKVLSLLSGNTFGARVWSDNKREAPMLPSVSFVQKCPQCSKYYIMSRQEVRYAKDGFSFELGTLNYSEMVDAFNQLEAEGFKDIDEELNVRILLFHAYNDMFRNDNKPTDEVNESDKNLFRKNTLWLIENWTKDDVLQAELYREIGEMKKAKTLLENVNTDKDFLIKIKNEMIKRININDTKVFEITSLIK